MKDLADFIEYGFTLVVSSIVGWLLWTSKQEKQHMHAWRTTIDSAVVDLTRRIALAEQAAHNEASTRATADTSTVDAIDALACTVKEMCDRTQEQHQSIYDKLTDIKVSIAKL